MLVWLTMAGILVIDRLIKIAVMDNFVPHETKEVIPQIFHLTLVLNPGAAFGLMAEWTWIFIITALLVFGHLTSGRSALHSCLNCALHADIGYFTVGRLPRRPLGVRVCGDSSEWAKYFLSAVPYALPIMSFTIGRFPRPN